MGERLFSGDGVGETIWDRQRKMLEMIRTEPLDQVLTDNVLGVYLSRGKRWQYEEFIPGGQRVMVNSYGSGILMIKLIMEDGLNPKMVRAGFERVRELYLVDNVSKKGFRVRDLTDEYGTVVGVKAGSVLSNLDLVFDRSGARAEFFMAPAETGPIISVGSEAMTWAHELGHSLQHDDSEIKGKRGLYSYSRIQRQRFSDNVLLGTPFLMFGLSIISSEMKREFYLAKESIGIAERNATAFTIAVSRRLREQGIDVFRGRRVREVVSIYDHYLQSYDKGWRRVLGPAISNRERAKERTRVVSK
jgi:hypothetical protein